MARQTHWQAEHRFLVDKLRRVRTTAIAMGLFLRPMYEVVEVVPEGVVVLKVLLLLIRRQMLATAL